MAGTWTLDLSDSKLRMGVYEPGLRKDSDSRISAREYLSKLDLDALLKEEEKALEAIRGGPFSGIVEIPGDRTLKVFYVVRPSEYLDLVHQRIEKVLLS